MLNSAVMSDTTLDVLDELDRITSEIELTADLSLELAEESHEKGQGLYEGFLRPNRPVWSLYASFQDFSRTASPFTNDLEVVIDSDRLTSLLGSIQFEPIVIQEGERVVVATPLSPPTLNWSNLRAEPPLPDCIALDMTWRIESDRTQPITLIVRIFFVLEVRGDRNTLKLVLSNAPRFYDESYQKTRPLRMVPMLGGQRSQIRKKLFAKIREQVGAIEHQLSNIDVGERELQFTPHCYTIDRDLILIDRHLGKRRNKYDLARPLLWRANQGVRLKSDHVIPEIVQRVRQQDVNVEAVEFRNGYIYLRVHKNHVERPCHMKVTVDAWIEYQLHIRNDLPFDLFVDAYATSIRTRIKIERCWPICGKVMRKAKEKARQELAKYYHLIFPFADFSGEAFWVRARTTSYGLTMEMEAW